MFPVEALLEVFSSRCKQLRAADPILNSELIQQRSTERKMEPDVCVVQLEFEFLTLVLENI